MSISETAVEKVPVFLVHTKVGNLLMEEPVKQEKKNPRTLKGA